MTFGLSIKTKHHYLPPNAYSSCAHGVLSLLGQVSGNHNTTFISSGQVVNFSGDVIVVYVGPASLGSDGAPLEGDFASPVQEEANETAPFFQSSVSSAGNSIIQKPLRDDPARAPKTSA